MSSCGVTSHLNMRSIAIRVGLALWMLSSAACGTAGSAGVSGSYTISLARPAAVGASWSEAIRLRDDIEMHLRAAGQPLEDRTRSLTIELDGVVTVLDRGADGARRFGVAVGRFVVDDGHGSTAPEVPSELVVTLGTVGSIESAGGPVDPIALGWLREVLDPRTRERSAGEDLFGNADEPRTIGAEWPIDSSAAARNFSWAACPSAPTDMSGSVRLVGIERVDMTDCLILLERVVATGCTPVDFPPEASMESAELRWERQIAIPIDQAILPLRDIQRVEAHFEFTGPVGLGVGHVSVVRRSERTVERTL